MGLEAALISGLLNIVGTKLAPLVTAEVSSIAGVTKDLQEFKDLVQGISIWLEKVDDRPFNWLKELKDAAYDAEDLVNEFDINSEKHDAGGVGEKNAMVKYLWKKPKSFVFKCEIAHKIKGIKKRFDAIVKGRSDYSTIANSMPVDRPVQHIKNIIGEVPLWTLVDETLIVGRDQEKNLIISELIKNNDQHKIKIVSVIGLGGSGKTTLAKLVFNDATIKNHFDDILWVHVSREFDVEKLVEKLFEAIAGNKPSHISLERVSRTISDKLAGKRFLAILDDVWTEDRIHWEQFMVHLKNGAPGSSILLTSRSRQVAEAVDSTYKYDLPFLSEEVSWEVFQKTFGMSVKNLDTEFLHVGKDIVKKCGGVPLAIKVLAGILCGMKGIEEWQSIRQSNLLDVEDKERRVSECLRLSYFHLPHHLKLCFTHCSIFPRGYVINRRHLISQWIAHGFMMTNQARQPEDVGIDYFDFLLKVGFLQDRQQYLYTSEVTCKMHDLVHDLSRKVLVDEFVSEIATADKIKRCRYLSLTSCTGKLDSKLFDKVRALYVSGCNLAFDKIKDNRCFVRTIILKYISVGSLLLFVSKFEHLGYLEISNINCEAIPESISHCWNLQAIHVIKCTRLAVLPESIGRLKKLRTLELNDSRCVRALPQSIGDCDNLRSLYLSGCTVKDLPNSIGKLENLRVLSTLYCMDLQQLLPAESYGKLYNLRTITLSHCFALQHLPECITSLGNLESLDVGYCSLVELPQGIGNLRKLEVLNLEGCRKLCGLPAGSGQLTRLRQLGLFVIGDSIMHARISELENLDKLNGELRIKNIKNVKDPGDAEKVRLKEKNGIHQLSLDWYSKSKGERDFVEVRTEELLSDMEKDLHLLNFLEPPSEIKVLRISGYQGLQLPNWMMKMDMVNLSNPPRFSHLTKLVLENLPNLVELLTTTTGLANGDEEDEVKYYFPHLSILEISDCPNLNVKPYFPPSLRSLTLEGSNEQLMFFRPHHAHADESSSSSCIVDVRCPELTALKLSRVVGSSSGWEVLQQLTCLRSLEISGCNDLRQLPESMRGLTNLRRLQLQHCNNLCMMPEWLGELQSLEALFIQCLPSMSFLPDSIQHLTSLQSLTISHCNAFHQLPEQLGELCSLSELQILSLPALTYLPDSMQRLTSLRLLNLYHCNALTQLPEWLGELSALRQFWIQDCPGLTSLPHSMRRLTTLEALMIRSCPELVRRCKEGVGEDWHLVSHIPDLDLQ